MAAIMVLFFNAVSGQIVVVVEDGTFSGAAMMDTPFGG